MDLDVTQGTADYAGTLLTGRPLLLRSEGPVQVPELLAPQRDVLPSRGRALSIGPEPTASAGGPRSRLRPTRGTRRTRERCTGPGPGIGTPLASIAYDFVGPLLVSLGPGSYTVFKQWAANQSAVPGFILRSPLTREWPLQGAERPLPRSLHLGQRNHDHRGGHDRRRPLDLYLHPPLSPAAGARRVAGAGRSV